MAKGNAIVMYLEQARIHGEQIGVTRSEVLFTKPNGYTVQPHNRVVSKADNKTMGESFLNELIYVLGAEDGEERKLPYDREVLVYTSDEINSDNYRTYINAVNTGIDCPVHNFKLCQKLRRLCDERGYHLFFNLKRKRAKRRSRTALLRNPRRKIPPTGLRTTTTTRIFADGCISLLRVLMSRCTTTHLRIPATGPTVLRFSRIVLRMAAAISWLTTNLNR